MKQSFINALFCVLIIIFPIITFADESNPTPPANATDKELADYYAKLAQHYQTLAKRYQLQAEINKSTTQVNLPLVPHKTKNPTFSKAAFAGTYAGLGYIMNTGNVSSRNLYTKGYLQYQPTEKSLTTGLITYQNAYDRDEGQIADKLYMDLNSAYNFDGIQGVYGDMNYTRDTFSGYNYIANQSAGYNRDLYKTDKTILSMQVGPGLQEQQPQGGEQQNNPSANLKLNFQHDFGASNNWKEIFTTTATKLNTNFTLDSSLTTTIYEKFALQLDVLASDDTHPLPGKFGLNTTTTLSLIYNF